jgi:hypothetical protein
MSSETDRDFVDALGALHGQTGLKGSLSNDDDDNDDSDGVHDEQKEEELVPAVPPVEPSNAETQNPEPSMPEEQDDEEMIAEGPSQAFYLVNASSVHSVVIAQEGHLNFADLSMDVDAMQMYAGCDDLGAVPYVFKDAYNDGTCRMWSFSNLINGLQPATSSRVNVQMNQEDEQVPRSSPKTSHKAKSVALHKLPNITIASCDTGGL